jgi:glucose-6-phosphate 1-dehydrogenase
MIQNHLLMVLALFAMEIPTRLDQRPFRSNRAAVLYSIPSPTIEQIRTGSVRGRYTAGFTDGREVPSYVDEPGVDPSRGTETYAAVTLGINTRRWAHVPFVLRSGKALAADHAEIVVRFAPVPAPAGRPTAVPNLMRIGLLEPTVQIEVNTLASGRIPSRSDLAMSMCSDRRPAYANMLLDMLNGDTRASVRGDEAEEAWRIVEPVLEAWAGDEVPLLEYPAGSHGPS